MDKKFLWIGALLVALVGMTQFVASADILPVSPFPPITPEQALANEGQNVTVEGVASVSEADGHLGLFVSLNGHGMHAPFAGYIPEGNESQFRNLQDVEGRTVDITGVVQFLRGFPVIKMTSGAQLKIAR